ncbi:flavin-containing monooxygenase [Larkinella sp. GY13]|jgi:putative flavoprotein involved in K+ transport|uniref:flavin-containing monooxygenase n=1 Tax=Larkinella sp. GY13 TaxID=3453720 RepID=UPI003EED1FA8
MNPLEVIVVGAGHAGLSTSYFLKQHGLSHLVLERGTIGESWVSQRWDSFRMNTANKLNTLPGCEPDETDPDTFDSAQSLAVSMQRYVQTHRLPVLAHTLVTRIDQEPGSTLFRIRTTQNGRMSTYTSRHVVIASGAQSKPQTALLESKIAPEIRQIHSSQYRNVTQLPEGNVLIVGSAQSGCQIAEDLVDAGKTVYLATSRVPRCPRHYRGKDIMDWLILTDFFNVRPDEVPDHALLHLKTPLLKGTDNGRKTLSLQMLAKKGVILLGKMQEITDGTARFSADALTHVRFADDFSRRVKAMIDAFIAENQLTAPAAELDPDDEPDPLLDISQTPTAINFRQQEITSLIWATGFVSDFSYIHLPVFDNSGNPVLQDGLSPVDGLYFLGLHWLRSRKSSVLFGIKDDAKWIADQIFSIVHQQNQAAIQSE